MRAPLLRRTQAGFTLIELLVVIAIIAVLIGLLLPAVQKVREAAARSQCQNNLKQMGLACHMYQDSNSSLPSGWVTSAPGGAVAPSPGWSWATLILPFIEQGTLYANLAPDIITPNGPPAANVLLQTRIKIYRCPADASSDVNALLNNYGMSNYVINREVVGPGRTNGNNTPNAMAIQSIPDGSSNTILIGERDSTRNIGAVWVRANQTSGSFEGRPGPGINPPLPAGTTQFSNGSAQRLDFGSLHSNGCNFLLCDGSVQYISNSISADPADIWTNFPALQTNFPLQNLIHPSDGNPVGSY
jgi:prepilin-type N-terminal cleavage/methylation domain-containing protein/prepilin-type processing-associated H-X9-DG protein